MSHFTLSCGGWEARVDTRGASLISLVSPKGTPWLPPAPIKGRHLFGSVAGPWANRLPAQPWGLSANAGDLHLHGGFRGADRREWLVDRITTDTLVLILPWPEGDEGYPRLELRALYRLGPGYLEVELLAQAERPIPLNPVNHIYWCLGEPMIDRLELRLRAMEVRPPRHGGMTAPPGEPNPFAEWRPVTGRWDHTFLLEGGTEPVAELRASSGRLLVWTDAPALHLYSGDYLPKPRTGLCLECGLAPGGWDLTAPTGSYHSLTRFQMEEELSS